MKRNVLLLILVVIGCIVITGCKKEESKKPIVGKWAHGSFIYTFNEDGSCSYDVSGKLMKCTYKTDGSKLSILYEGMDTTFDTTFSIEDNKLNVKDTMGNNTYYDKQ